MSITTFISTKIPFTASAALLLGLVACQSGGPSRENDTSQLAAESAAEARQEPEEEEAQAEKLSIENAPEFLKAYAEEHPEKNLRIETPHGDITIELYENTPMHRANMIFLAREGYYDDTWFHRVSGDHVIQAGNSDKMSTVEKRREIGHYKLPPEALAKNFHRRGAVAAARSYSNNPDKKSDAFEFYIAVGRSYTMDQLRTMQEQQDLDLNREQEKIYSTQGGSPHLDGEHTVFGRVTSGMEVVEKINNVETDEGEWPLKNIPIQVEVLDD